MGCYSGSFQDKANTKSESKRIFFIFPLLCSILRNTRQREGERSLPEGGTQPTLHHSQDDVRYLLNPVRIYVSNRAGIQH